MKERPLRCLVVIKHTHEKPLAPKSLKYPVTHSVTCDSKCEYIHSSTAKQLFRKTEPQELKLNYSHLANEQHNLNDQYALSWKHFKADKITVNSLPERDQEINQNMVLFKRGGEEFLGKRRSSHPGELRGPPLNCSLVGQLNHGKARIGLEWQVPGPLSPEGRTHNPQKQSHAMSQTL